MPDEEELFDYQIENWKDYEEEILRLTKVYNPNEDPYIEEFENDTFGIFKYKWPIVAPDGKITKKYDEEDPSWEFHHKPSGTKIFWFRYPHDESLLSPTANQEITIERFRELIDECIGSLGK